MLLGQPTVEINKSTFRNTDIAYTPCLQQRIVTKSEGEAMSWKGERRRLLRAAFSKLNICPLQTTLPRAGKL